LKAEGLPEPIELELDLENRVLYWTDRGDLPRGNTVNGSRIDTTTPRQEIILTQVDGWDRHRPRGEWRPHVCHRPDELLRHLEREAVMPGCRSDLLRGDGTMIRAHGIDWLQVVLMVLAATCIVALIAVDLFS
jgi:hypothetical protein